MNRKFCERNHQKMIFVFDDILLTMFTNCKQIINFVLFYK